MSKACLVLLVMFPFLTFSQNCDTLYSHEKYIERRVALFHRNCSWLYADTMYWLVRWGNHDPEYQTTYFVKNDCYSIFNTKTGRLIEEGWRVIDTFFTKTYYTSGKLKSYGSVYSSVFSAEDSTYFAQTSETYYENGGLLKKSKLSYGEFNQICWFYPDGSLQSVGTLYDANPGFWGTYKEYYQNGQLSSLLTYSMPDTTDHTYQDAELLSAKYYSIDGKEVEADLNELKRMEIVIYPPKKSEWTEIENGLYAWEHFSDQAPYSNQLAELKNRILCEITLPESCDCKTGVFWFSAVVNKKGEIEVLDVEIADPILKKSVEDAIRKVNYWPPGELNGDKVDTFIYTFLIINNQ